jgi:serine/threonine-protein kinase
MGDLLRRVASEPAPDLRTLRPELPAALAAQLARLLAKRPAERPASAGAVAAELTPLLPGWPGGRGVTADGPKSR